MPAPVALNFSQLLSRPVFPCQRYARVHNEPGVCRCYTASLLPKPLGSSADTGFDDSVCYKVPAGLGHSLKRDHSSRTMACRYRGDAFRRTARKL